MNIQELDILRTLREAPFTSQRALSETTGHSVGVVNRSLKLLSQQGYVDRGMTLTPKAMAEIDERSPKNAVILAAGFGMRMVPINMSTPKALLEVNGEKLIDRLIRQLHEAGVTDITVIVGFMKDAFEYLIDEFGVRLLFNPDYASKNNLHSLFLASDQLRNTYVVPCDLWCESNPFSAREVYSWYMVSDRTDAESTVRVNRKTELVKVAEKDSGNAMIGIAYLRGPEVDAVRERLCRLDDAAHADAFWEEALYHRDRMLVPARVVRDSFAVEINTYEQLRELDAGSIQLRSEAIHTIARVFDCDEDEIANISVLKKGMTNRSFLFTVKDAKYIMRIPGEGTDRLIDRAQEAEVYRAISGLGLCDDPVYIDPKNGFKITKFLNDVRVCDPDSKADLGLCMDRLRSFHEMKLSVPHTFDIFGQIDFYEGLWAGNPSVYRDYHATKANVFSLRPFIERARKDWCLTHIDAVSDNFLFFRTGDGEERLQLTDWEYSGMQDPHVDIAMFCVYSMYDRAQCDRLIDIYFKGACDRETRIKIYCYIAACGLLWSNWCEYKRTLGVEFGDYSLCQYRFAKDYYRLARAMLEA